MNRENKIKNISLIILYGFLISIIFHLFLDAIGLGYPKNTFLFRPWTRFSDYYNWLYWIPNNLNPYLFTRPSPFFNMTPFSYLIGFFLSVLPRKIIFYIFFGGFISMFAFINYRNLINHIREKIIVTVGIITFLSYPFIFSIDRGNMEFYIFILLYFFVDNYKKRNNFIAVILLSIAASLKIVPILFVLLFIKRKEYKEAVMTVVITLLLNFGPLLIFAGGIKENIVRYSENIALYNYLFSITDEGLFFGSSLYGLIKSLIYLATNVRGYQNIWVYVLFNNYKYLIIALSLIIFPYLVLIEKKLWKVIALIVISMNLLPYVSGDYKLFHFFLPLYLFINEKKKESSDFLYVILFSLLLVPKSYFYDKISVELSSSVVLNPLIMLCLGCLIIYEGLRNYKISNLIKHG